MTQYGVENVRNCILWVGRQFKLEIFCSNVYADDDGTTIFEPVKRIKDIEACKNIFLSYEHACSHSTLSYLRHLIGVTMPSS